MNNSITTSPGKGKEKERLTSLRLIRKFVYITVNMAVQTTEGITLIIIVGIITLSMCALL